MQLFKKEKFISVLHCTVLIIAVLFAYSTVFNAGFTSWDDADYTIGNKDIYAFGIENIKNWFSKFYVGHYQPLTIASYAFDYLIGRQEPFTYHLTNIVLHVANTILLYVFVNRIQRHIWVAFFVAVLFAIHPVQTESVSWVAERKNVLYGFFFLLSMVMYTRYVTGGRKSIMILVTLAGLAAILSKSAAVVLPFSLIAIDIWLGRQLKDKQVWIEKLPLLAAGIIAGVLAIRAQDTMALLNVHTEYSWYETVILAGYTYVQYIMQLLVPVKLSVLYPYPQSIGLIHFLYLFIAVGIVIVGIIAYRRKWNMLLGGIVFYTANIALFLQFLQFGEVLMADRYLYIACIGVWLPIVYYIFEWAAIPSKINIAIISLSIVSLSLLYMVKERNNIWLSEMQFWESVVATFPESSVAQSSIGGVFMKEGNYPEAMTHINEAIRIDAGNYKAWYNKGVLHLRRNELQEGLNALNRCIEIHEYPKAFFSRALLYHQQGNVVHAARDIEKVLAEEPENARAYFIRGSCMEKMENYLSAIDNYDKAVMYGGYDKVFFLRRGISYVHAGKYAAAMGDLSVVTERNGNIGEAWYWLGIAKQLNGQTPCNDLSTAHKLGYTEAAQALEKFCNGK